MPFHVGPPELIVVLVIVMVVFGVGKLPQVGGAMGKAIREFRHAERGELTEQAPALSDPSRGAHKQD